MVDQTNEATAIEATAPANPNIGKQRSLHEANLEQRRIDASMNEDVRGLQRAVGETIGAVMRGRAPVGGRTRKGINPTPAANPHPELGPQKGPVVQAPAVKTKPGT